MDTYSGVVDFARERKVADHTEAERPNDAGCRGGEVGIPGGSLKVVPTCQKIGDRILNQFIIFDPSTFTVADSTKNIKLNIPKMWTSTEEYEAIDFFKHQWTCKAKE